MEFVRPARPGTYMKKEQKSIQPVWVPLLFGHNALEDSFRGDEILVSLAGVVRIGARAGSVIDQDKVYAFGPLTDLCIVMFVRGQEVSNGGSRRPEPGRPGYIPAHIQLKRPFCNQGFRNPIPRTIQ